MLRSDMYRPYPHTSTSIYWPATFYEACTIEIALEESAQRLQLTDVNRKLKIKAILKIDPRATQVSTLSWLSRYPSHAMKWISAYGVAALMMKCCTD